MSKYSDIQIEWFGEIRAKMGYGLQARRMLRPLIEGGATVKLIPDESYLPDHMKISDPFWEQQIDKSKYMADMPIRICYCLPTRAQPNVNSMNIFYAMWETNQYPREWADIINKMSHVFWAGCESLVESAKAARIQVPILHMNASLDTNEWASHNVEPLSINEIPDSDVKYLFIGNFIPRKNLEELVLGFNVAFDGCPDASLIIKTWSGNNSPEGKKHIADAIRHFSNKATGLVRKPKITVISDIMEEDQIKSLIKSCDFYTTVSYGEGFDLPLMQAMSMGKVPITTRFLAHRDYLNDNNSIDVKYSLMPCKDAAAPLYDSYQAWSRPDMGSYIEALRSSYMMYKKHMEKYNQKSSNAISTIVNKFDVRYNTDNLAHTIRQSKVEYEKRKQSVVQQSR